MSPLEETSTELQLDEGILIRAQFLVVEPVVSVQSYSEPIRDIGWL